MVVKEEPDVIDIDGIGNLGGDYIIPVSRDEILSHFAGIPAVS